MSRRNFARRTGVSETSLGRYERGDQPVPPWMGLVVSAALFCLPAYRGRMMNTSRHLYSLRDVPPQARLTYFSSCFAAAALFSPGPKADAIELVEAEADQLRAIAGALRVWAELASEERLPWHEGAEEVSSGNIK